MTSFEDDNGNILDYDGEDFLITKQAMSVLNFKITGDKSTNFKLENSAINRKALGIDGLNQISSPALSKIQFNLKRNGNLSLRGYIVIQRISKELECYFVAGNANWFTDFDFNIKEVNLNDFASDNAFWRYDYIATRVASDDGIVFPLADWVYNRGKMSFVFSNVIYSGDASDFEGIYSDFYPCFYLKSLAEYVLRHAGYKLGGDILIDPLYNSTVITPESGELSYPQAFIDERKVSTYMASSQLVNTVGGSGFKETIELVTLIENNNFNNTNHTYIADGNFTLLLTISLVVDTSQTYTVALERSGSSLGILFASGTTLIGSAECVYPIGIEAFVTITSISSFTILSGTVTIEIKRTIKPPTPLSTTGSYLNPVGIIPSMKAIDLMKVIAIRYASVVTFNEYSKTINFNKFDKITTVEDWSDYLVSYILIYEKGSKNNYIRMNQPDELSGYNDVNNPKFGETNLSTEFDVNQDNELYTDPFPGALDSSMPSSLGWTQPFVPLINLTDDAEFTVTSISDSGFSGLAQLNGSGFDVLNNTIIRFADDTGYYTGYHKVQSSSSTAIIINTIFVATSTGTMFSQTAKFNNATSRLLINQPNYYWPNLGTSSIAESVIGFSMDKTGDYSDVASFTNYPYAYFSKPTTGRAVDQLKPSLSYGQLNIPGYNDIPIDENYKTVKNMLNGPILRAQMLLPESVLQNFNSDKFIRLRHKDFTGVFWVDRINNYKDAHTLVEVDFLNAYKNG